MAVVDLDEPHEPRRARARQAPAALTTDVSAEQVAQLLTVLARRSAPAPYRTRSRRLVAAV